MAMYFEDVVLGCFVSLSQVYTQWKRTLNINSLCGKVGFQDDTITRLEARVSQTWHISKCF